ncbi:hypothetical protein [Paludisphaera mucosa]|uniref:Zinc ribbon domain-containing protein n=1 Tax=Paludisphaera mucosa TaxID=3030827 RepID=A0ABT6F4U1_9BACT|nr:hypothetical protein [Paludisphaera mucosa]MDG3002574.1 hypothetical protein [Paludisphaera mucosa]
MVDFILFAARHKQDPSGIEAVLTLLGIAVVLLIYLFQPSKQFIRKNGVPCCPQCGRQISLKASRPNCRACGASLMTGRPLLDLTSKSEVADSQARQRTAREEWLRKQAQETEEARRRRVVEDAFREEVRLAKAERRKGKIEENGGYSDLQLYGVGALVVLVPVALTAGLYLLFAR